MIDLPMKAEVFCSDGPAGRSMYVIGKPGNYEITYLVVKSYLPPFHEYLIPVDRVEETTSNRIHLNCTREELNRMELFEVEEFVSSEIPGYLSGLDAPDVPAVPGYTTEPVTTLIPAKRRNIPEGTFVIRRSARVEATDGQLGQVDDLLIDSSNMQITHLTVLVGHLLEQRKIRIPISQVEKIYEETIHLSLDRQGVKKLPAAPSQR